MALLCFGVVSSLPFDNCLMSLCRGVNFFFAPIGLLHGLQVQWNENVRIRREPMAQ